MLIRNLFQLHEDSHDRCSHVSGSTNGGEKMILLCDIVEKDDIEIAFFTLNDHLIGMGNFSQFNVWHHHSIVFTTPPCESNVAVQAKLFLRRISNQNDRSNFFPFHSILHFLILHILNKIY